MPAYWLYVVNADGKNVTMWGWADSEELALTRAKVLFSYVYGFSDHKIKQIVGDPPDLMFPSFDFRSGDESSTDTEEG
jgi:hypothetical protein